jgi:hypothetical protein
MGHREGGVVVLTRPFVTHIAHRVGVVLTCHGVFPQKELVSALRGTSKVDSELSPFRKQTCRTVIA